MDTDTLMSSKIENAILEDGQKRVYVCYSAYNTDEEDNPIDNLDEIAVKGKAILFGSSDEFWGGEKSRDYRSKVLENPTWLLVTVHANAMIRRVRDTHHVFLEGLQRISHQVVDGEKIPVYEFCMGS